MVCYEAIYIFSIESANGFYLALDGFLIIDF
jgi:hypothetical protein